MKNRFSRLITNRIIGQWLEH